MKKANAFTPPSKKGSNGKQKQKGKPEAPTKKLVTELKQKASLQTSPSPGSNKKARVVEDNSDTDATKNGLFFLFPFIMAYFDIDKSGSDEESTSSGELGKR